MLDKVMLACRWPIENRNQISDGHRARYIKKEGERERERGVPISAVISLKNTFNTGLYKKLVTVVLYALHKELVCADVSLLLKV